MTSAQTKPTTPAAAQELGDESFMSAADLRAYMTEMDMANASKEIDRMDRAEKAQQELIKSCPPPLTPRGCRR